MSLNPRVAIPKYTGKSGLEDLAELPRADLDISNGLSSAPCLYSDRQGDVVYDYLFSPESSSNRLFVLFSGDAPRTKFTPPVFQRWRWSHFFPGHCLYVSDPTLRVSNVLGLAWYAGTQVFDPLQVISRMVISFAKSLGVDLSNVYTYGSSGGGFAALRMLTLVPEINGICVNPQTNIVSYNNGAVGKFFNTCFGGRSRDQMALDFPERIDLISQSSMLLGRKIIYMQNLMDLHHYDDHYLPFCEALGEVPLSGVDLGGRDVCTQVSINGFRSIVFSDMGGHSKAEANSAFRCAMSSIL